MKTEKSEADTMIPAENSDYSRRNLKNYHYIFFLLIADILGYEWFQNKAKNSLL